ncbi:MAG: hypothetical protein RM347_024935 [Nostoc sp. ChiQUE02]|nr:hypothetical protein [Nostoc sp. ChiQUE02]
MENPHLELENSPFFQENQSDHDPETFDIVSFGGNETALPSAPIHLNR